MLTDSRASIIARYHAMLEFDPINNAEEFSDLFTLLVNKAGIPGMVLAVVVNQDLSLVKDWIDGNDIPSESEWPAITHKILALLMCLACQDIDP